MVYVCKRRIILPLQTGDMCHTIIHVQLFGGKQ